MCMNSMVALVVLVVMVAGVSGFRTHRPMRVVGHTAPQATIASIEGELKQYLEARETMDLPPMSPIEATAAEQALAMVKPSGWNRDVEKEDFERRSDKRVPKQPHPLSFIELERHGFKHLIEPVMELGGPHKVYTAIGLDWLEPSEEERWDPALKVTPFSTTL